MLAAGPPRIADLTAGLTPGQLVAPPAPGEWSLRDILAHLRACNDMWGGCIRLLLEEDRPVFKAMNPVTWVKQTDYLAVDFRPSFAALAGDRAALVAQLEPLPAEAWSRGGTALVAGRPRERTVSSYAHWLANHERSHLKHIARLARDIQTPKGDTYVN